MYAQSIHLVQGLILQDLLFHLEGWVKGFLG